jgi:ribonucleoside-diphosphate reductase alpha chain
MNEVDVLKNLETLVPYKKESFTEFAKFIARDLKNIDYKVQTLVEEVELAIFSDMTLEQLLESAILIATQNIQNDIEFDKMATRILLLQGYRDALELDANESDFTKVYKSNFKNYIHKGIGLNLLNPEMASKFDLDRLANELVINYDEDYNYIGLTTLAERYSLHDRDDKLMETPQFAWMRVAMGLSLKEDNPTERAITFYNKLATKEYIPGGSTNIGAGTTFAVLSNCYLMETQDDIDSIFDNVKNVAKISKATGGIGISVTKLRSSGSKVRSNNTISTGPIPFIKVMDATLKSMARGGKKFGAMCVYMENWHLDFQEFIDLKQNNGDDYRRIRTADTAVYISDEFMKRVVNGEDWYLFNPDEVRDLAELYGKEFSSRYNTYVEMAKRGEIEMFKVIPAREQMRKILTALQGTSHPWLTWKDTINVRALNNNTGTIHCSNLCTEICLPQDRENIAVCNLAYINLIKHVKNSGETIDEKIDWDQLQDTVRVLMRHLDNLVEVNQSPLPETKNSDEKNRAVGMGMSGFAETLEKFGYAYDSQEAYDLMDKVTEFVSYISIDESCNLAEERGSYANFEGSLWSQGYVPFDTIEKVAKDRLGLDVDQALESMETEVKSENVALQGVDQTLVKLKDKIENGLQNASSQESKELYEIFNQLTQFIQNSNPTVQLEKSEQSVPVRLSSHRIARDQHGNGVELDQDVTYTMDWDRLRSRVKKGMRNATTMAIAPNASTGLVLGTSPGIDPRFAQIFSRQTSNGKFLDINPNLVEDLQELGIWDDVKTEVLQNYGDISEIEGIPDKLKEVYKTCFQISPYAFIEVASRAQKWIDQSMSRNMYLETRDVDEMMEIYTEAWRRGLKTTYYLHVKPRHKAEQSTVKVNKRESMNKAGFGAVTSAGTSQPSFDGTVEKKGFGFATDNIEKKEESQPVSSSGGFGFGAVAQSSDVEEKVQFKPERVEVNMQACPLDPAERANCEACQ